MIRPPLGLRRRMQRLRRAKWVSVISVSALAAARGRRARLLDGARRDARVGDRRNAADAVDQRRDVAPESVTLSWTAVSPPGAGTVTYYVSRDGLPPSGGCPNSGSPSTVTSCVDAPVPVGTHTYAVTALWRTWTARSETKTVVVPSGVATHFVLEAASVTPTAGEADNLTMTAKDASNNTVEQLQRRTQPRIRRLERGAQRDLNRRSPTKPNRGARSARRPPSSSSAGRRW